MSLHDQLTGLQAEKEEFKARLKKLEDRKDKVRPELYDKLRSEIDVKMGEVEQKIIQIEQEIQAEEERLLAEEEARRQAEEARLLAEEEARLEAEEEARRLAAEKSEREPTPEEIRERLYETYGDELEALSSQWNEQIEGKRRECQDYIAARAGQSEALAAELDATQTELEELELRNEIGEFEDDEAGYAAALEPVTQKREKLSAESATAKADVEQVQRQLTEIDDLIMPDFEAQLIEKYHDELTAVIEEEIYEPVSDDDLAEGRVVSEEVLADGEGGEGVVTEIEEIYEDEIEQEFFEDADERASRLITATVNPCLIEERPDGAKRVHNLILAGSFAGGKTMIGSQEDCDIYLPYPDIAAKHAWVKVDRKGTYYLKDLGSPNGTFVNDKRTKKVQLKTGDLLRVGNTMMEVKLM